jgi:hypothetical protein
VAGPPRTRRRSGHRAPVDHEIANANAAETRTDERGRREGQVEVMELDGPKLAITLVDRLPLTGP